MILVAMAGHDKLKVNDGKMSAMDATMHEDEENGEDQEAAEKQNLRNAHMTIVLIVNLKKLFTNKSNFHNDNWRVESLEKRIVSTGMQATDAWGENAQEEVQYQDA